MRIVLASASPRRADLLDQLGVEYTVDPADIDESVLEDESPSAYVVRVARAKCHAVMARSTADSIVLAADTTVTIDGEILGKPQDANDALDMLALLSGRSHEVLSGVAVAANGTMVSAVESTRVHFAKVTAEEAKWYVSNGEPMDKAGAYAMQGAGSLFVASIVGSADNVIGLPRRLTAQLFEEIGHQLTDFAAPRHTG